MVAGGARLVRSVLLRSPSLSMRLAGRVLLRGVGAGVCIAAAPRAACARCAEDESSILKAAAASLTGSLTFGGPDEPASATGDFSSRCVQTMWPILSRLGFAGIVGVCCAQATKSATKLVAVYLGAGVITLQILSQWGYVTVHWDRLKKDVQAIADVDGDGDFTSKDMSRWTNRALHLMSNGMPQAGGFASGFWVGFVYI